MRDYIIIGKIIEVNEQYTRIIIQSKLKRYSIEYSHYKMNKFGYIPKISHWIKVEGELYKENYDSLIDGNIKNVKNLEHIKN